MNNIKFIEYLREVRLSNNFKIISTHLLTVLIICVI